MTEDAVSLRPPEALLRHTAAIVTAHLSNSAVTAEALPEMIKTVFAALSELGQAPEPLTPAQEPAVPIRRSVFPDYIVCLEDGKKFKTLKRHLTVAYGLTPDQYRQKWGLPPDYPMVAPSYAAHRSSLAHAGGLGRVAATPAKTVPVAAAETTAVGHGGSATHQARNRSAMPTRLTRRNVA